MSEEELYHYGTPRHSGRYPWGSGKEAYQRDGSFLSYIDGLKKSGMTEEVATAAGMSIAQLRARRSIVIAEERAADRAFALRLKDKGYSNVAIGERMNKNESSIRLLLDDDIAKRSDKTNVTADMLKNALLTKPYLDVGAGVENHLGISRTKLKTSIVMLEEEGYKVYYVKTTQLGTGKPTTVMVLAEPGTEWKDVWDNKDQIGMISPYDTKNPYTPREPIQSVDGKRVMVRYGEDGGGDKDGVIEIRRGVDDISLGQARYAQVRIGVDGTHYLKGMAMYSDNLPDGVDIIYNTPKSNTKAPKDIYKTMTDDPKNPFGAATDPKYYLDTNGKMKLSKLNVINEEGDWSTWSKSLSSQVMSKQQPATTKKQLDLALAFKKAEYDEIMAYTNPAVRKKLLDAFADDCDSSAVHLKAAAMPRQASHVILPIKDMKENEVYAPNYKNGEQVVLIRHPHGGIFEIPNLVVNNKSVEANKYIKNAKDAIGINPKVAARLSGADFDGDTVIVIPNPHGAIKTAPSLQKLKDFDPQRDYAAYEGMPKVSATTGFRTPIQMGGVSNLITDMTIKGALPDEVARAVKHSMVVIDAEKHNLNYKQSAIDNGISGLKKKYQGSANGGASTLVSRASSEKMVDQRKDNPKTDPATGKKVWEKTGETYVDKKGKTIVKKSKSTRMAEADDAFSLSSGTAMENIYATYANQMKALANKTRKASLGTGLSVYSPPAKKVYAKETASLAAKLNLALKNAPLERQAQLAANINVALKKEANPNMEKADIKKVSFQALDEARLRTGAKKQRIDITPKEWEAIQAGAISNNALLKILANTDLDVIKKYATPRDSVGVSAGQLSKAKAMKASGYTQAEIAEAIGVSTTTLAKELS